MWRVCCYHPLFYGLAGAVTGGVFAAGFAADGAPVPRDGANRVGGRELAGGGGTGALPPNSAADDGVPKPGMVETPGGRPCIPPGAP